MGLGGPGGEEPAAVAPPWGGVGADLRLWATLTEAVRARVPGAPSTLVTVTPRAEPGASTRGSQKCRINACSVSPLSLRQPGSRTFARSRLHPRPRDPAWERPPGLASRSGPGEGSAMRLLSCAGGRWAGRVVTHRGLHQKSPDPKSHGPGAVPGGPCMNWGATLRVPEVKRGCHHFAQTEAEAARTWP